MRQLIVAAVDHARQQGAQVLEAYPLDRDTGKSAMELYFGSLAAFRDNGFVEVARRLPSRPMVRLELT